MRNKRDNKIPVVDPSHAIPRNEHNISKSDISPNALKVLNRLNASGYDAYLVGGSVRDLLLRKAPKDFDVATNATPNQIRKLFKNARIIGRRFKLVHILFHREIIEVATFRGHESTTGMHEKNEQGMLIRDNVFGTLEEDAWRRDLTINSLYYCIVDSTIIDYTGGFGDVRNKTIQMIGDPEKRYLEDPVRMLRAIRFAAKLNFKLADETAKPIKKLNHALTHVSSSRLFDEMTKMYQCGSAQVIQQMLIEHQLFDTLFPQTHKLFGDDYPLKALIGIALENTDIRIKENKPVTPAFFFAILLWFPLLKKAEELRSNGTDPLPALEQAMSIVIAEQNRVVSIPKRFTQVMREIWILQYRLTKRSGRRAFNLLQHPRFRAAYDFLALRALAGDESMELADWWTSFQEVDADEKSKMVSEITPSRTRKRRRSNPKKQETKP